MHAYDSLCIQRGVRWEWQIWAQKRYLDFRANTLSVRRQLYWQAGGYPAFRVGQDMMLIARLNDLRRGYLDYR